MCTFNSLMQQNACYRDVKWTFEDLLPCYCYAIKTNSRTTVRDFRNQPLQAKEGTWVNYKLITAWHYICEPDSCAVWVSYRQKKLSLQESNQLIGIKISTSGFSRNIWFLIPISRGNPVLPLLRTLMRSLTILYQVPQTRPAHLMKRRNVFD